eukprot:COSAG03_NODE_4941_length_1383_cov_32.074766_1_plen_181_part_10
MGLRSAHSPRRARAGRGRQCAARDEPAGHGSNPGVRVPCHGSNPGVRVPKEHGPRDLNRGPLKRGRTLSVTVLRNGSNNVSLFLFYSRAMPRHLTRTDKCCAVATSSMARHAESGQSGHSCAVSGNKKSDHNTTHEHARSIMQPRHGILGTRKSRCTGTSPRSQAPGWPATPSRDKVVTPV